MASIVENELNVPNVKFIWQNRTHRAQWMWFQSILTFILSLLEIHEHISINCDMVQYLYMYGIKIANVKCRYSCVCV